MDHTTVVACMRTRHGVLLEHSPLSGGRVRNFGFHKTSGNAPSRPGRSALACTVTDSIRGTPVSLDGKGGQRWRPGDANCGTANTRWVASYGETAGQCPEAEKHWRPPNLWRVMDGSWRVPDSGWRVTDSSCRITGGGWRVTNSSCRITGGGWRVTDGSLMDNRTLPGGCP